MAKRTREGETLTALEEEIRRRLQGVLPAVAVDGRPIFTNREFNPHGLLPTHYSVESDELLDLCRQAERLRTRHGLGDDGCPSALYLSACAEAADLTKPHRLGPRRLAERLLRALHAV